jgi:hypothetical protein
MRRFPADELGMFDATQPDFAPRSVGTEVPHRWHAQILSIMEIGYTAT